MILRRLLLVACLLLLAACSPHHTLILDRQPRAVTWTRELGEQSLRQTLTVPAGTSEIELVLAQPESSAGVGSRPLRWELLDSAAQPLREGTVETAGALHNTPLRLRFEPIPTAQYVELVLTAPPNSGLHLWASQGDSYTGGTLLDEKLDQDQDLHFTLRAQETPETLWRALREASGRWQHGALWIPLLLLGPGWLLAWLLAPRDGEAVTPAVAGLSLSLAPFVYLATSLVGLRLYEPLVQSLFQASALGLLLLMLRDVPRVREAWRVRGRAALVLLALAIVVAVATWLLAGRALLAPSGASTLGSGLLAQQMVRTGLVGEMNAPLPLAAVAATLTQMSRQSVDRMLLLSALLLGVATLPALYALAAAVARDSWAALWLLPLAWLWPAPWQALAAGNLLTLFNLAVLPVAVALGLRALRPAAQPRALLLAAFPLAALALAQGVAALGAWLVALLLALLLGPAAPQGTEEEQPRRRRTVLARALGWLLLALALWLLAWSKGAGWKSPLPLPHTGYDWLALSIGLAAAAGWVARRLGRLAVLPALLVLLALPLLLWWRSVPLEATDTTLTQNEAEVLSWVRTGTDPDALFLINVEPEGDTLHPTDGGLWLPLYGERSTVLQRAVPREVIARAMQGDGLADAEVRHALQQAGVTHLYLGSAAGPIGVEEVLNQPWARIAHQSGPIYVFELLGNP